MINKNLKEGVLRLKWLLVEVYKDVFRNEKRCLQIWKRTFSELKKDVFSNGKGYFQN